MSTLEISFQNFTNCALSKDTATPRANAFCEPSIFFSWYMWQRAAREVRVRGKGKEVRVWSGCMLFKKLRDVFQVPRSKH